MTEITMSQAKDAAVDLPRSSRRWWPAMPGVLFVVTYIVGFVMVNPPNYDESDKTWVAYFADHGHQVVILVNAFLLTIAGMLLLTFLTRLHGRVDAMRATGRPDALPLVAAGVAGALIAAGGIVPATVPANALFQSLHIPSADILRLTSGMSYPLTAIGGMFAAGLAIATITLQAQRSGYFGRALSIFSYVAAVAAVAAFFFVPIAIVLIWVLIVSVVLARRPTGA